MKNLLTILPLLFLLSCEKDSNPESNCIDPNAIDPDAACYAVYDPVCGCDGVTYGNDCEAKVHGVKEFTSGACGCEYPYSGVVKNLSGTHGCGEVIELDNGSILEPVKLPDGVSLQEGSRVMFNYREVTTHPSQCMNGVMADVFCLKQSSCLPLAEPDFNYPAMPDKVTINSAKITGDCLVINFSYSGGCEQHDFELRQLIFFCATPPVPPTTLQFVHDAHGDACQALITSTLSYDLSTLRVQGQSSIPLMLVDYHGNYNANMTYKY